jgi:hypothetical protein
LYDEYGEPQSPYINIANDDPREDPGKQSRVSRDPIPLFFLSEVRVDKAAVVDVAAVPGTFRLMDRDPMIQ